LAAPEIFSLVENPIECASVFHNLLLLRGDKVFFDMKHVNRMTPDAIALLSACVRSLSARGVRVRGNYPVDPTANEVLRQSGFDEYFNEGAGPTPATRGQLVCEDRLDVDSKRAEARLAKKLIDFATNHQSVPSRLKCVYGHLVDCMTNTHEHASADAGTERWWASVFVDKERGCDCFTFIDLGVGIFQSIELNRRLKIMALFSITRPDIIRKIFRKEIPSSTGLSYRGRGLPSIYESLSLTHSISRLVIATNDVYGDVGPDRFVVLSKPLKGLLLYWEVNHDQD